MYVCILHICICTHIHYGQIKDRYGGSISDVILYRCGRHTRLQSSRVRPGRAFVLPWCVLVCLGVSWCVLGAHVCAGACPVMHARLACVCTHVQEVCVVCAHTGKMFIHRTCCTCTHTHRQEVHPQNMLLDLGKTLDEAGFEGGKAHPNVSFFS
jgi:hypothetical protein